MTKASRFNLIDEPWIPIADQGFVSLSQVFSNPDYRALGGNPVQKIALTKLLLAIAQAASTPEDDMAWQSLGANGLATQCLSYLGKWHECFWLYGERPFLQMPQVSVAATQNAGAVLPEIATGNTTVLIGSQIERTLSDAENALLILSLMGFALGGKKTDNSCVLAEGYLGKSNDKGKPATGKSGPSLGFMGFLHSFLQGETLLQTLWFNLFTQEQINQIAIYPAGLGVAPWEQMPESEACPAAKMLQQSLMGRLVPLSRFCLLNENGLNTVTGDRLFTGIGDTSCGYLHYTEGVTHSGYKEGVVDPSVAVDFSGKDAKVIWVDTTRKPWRFLTALLSFMSANGNGFNCFQLRQGLTRATPFTAQIGLWSGGLRVSSNAGEQYVSGSDDFIESMVLMPSEYLGETWYNQLKLEMNELESLSKMVYGATLGFFKSQNMEGKNQAGLASNLFWELSEREFQHLVNACADSEKIPAQRKLFAQFVQKAYDQHCPQDTARQLDAWAKNRPSLGKYLSH